MCLGPRPSVEEDFHVALSRDVNKNIVVPIKPRKFKPKLARPLSKQTVAAPAAATLCKRQLAHAASSAPELAGSIVTASLLDTRLVKNKKMKVQILDEYQEEYGGAYDSPITTTHLGTSQESLQPPSQFDLMKSTSMKPEIDKQYESGPFTFNNIVVLILDVHLENIDLLNLSKVSKLFNRVVPEVKRLLLVDWRPLLRPRLDYMNQKKINMHRVDMATALAIRCGLCPGKIVRTLRGEFVGANRNVEFILASVEDVVSKEDYLHIKRILTTGCPSKLKFNESQENKLKMIQRGNQKSLLDHPEIAEEVITKEDGFSHIIIFHDWICSLGPHLRHNSQGLVDLKRLVWDGSTKRSPTDMVMNDHTPTDDEAEIDFGTAKYDFYWLIYNMRVSYPESSILLALADIKACFRFPRIHPDLTGAFGFLINSLYCLAVAMVFGSNTSSSSWEPFRRAIEGLTKKIANRPDLVVKHKTYIDMIKWDLPKHNAPKPVLARKCKLNPGVLDSSGANINHPTRIWVDDALIAAVELTAMKMALAAVIEAIFVVLGQPDLTLRQCPLAMDKWKKLVVGEKQIALGLILKTREMTVCITHEYLCSTLHLIKTNWPNSKKRFSALEASKMAGKLARLTEGAPWSRYLLSQLYSSIAFALAQNKLMLSKSSPEFKRLAKTISSGNFSPSNKDNKEHQSTVRFALKKAARMVHHSSAEYNIIPSMKDELDFFKKILEPSSSVVWEAPIAYLIKKTPFATAFGDACLDAAGGFSVELKFWWHLQFPETVVRRTLKYLKDNRKKDLISINVLEFLTVIIDYCAAHTVITTQNVTDDPHPVLLSMADNTSAHSWTTHTCKGSMLGRLLAKFFCMLLMDYKLGINSEWISTHDNFIADDISRLKKLNTSSSKHFSFDYSALQQKYPQLRTCRFFQPSPSLLSCLWDILLHKKLPTLEEVRTLKQSGLGKLIT